MNVSAAEKNLPSAHSVEHAPRVLDNGLFLSALLAPCIVAIFLALSEATWHWFILPVLACGILIGADALDWLRGRRDIFDPIAIIGLLGVEFFLIAPLLHVTRDYWMPEIIPPPDWREWLGHMAIWNAIGLTIYRATRRRFMRVLQNPKPRTSWEIDPRRFWVVVPVALVITAFLQGWIYIQYGGIGGYINAIVSPTGQAAAQGMGWLFILADTFPIWALLAWGVYARDQPFARSWLVIGLVLLAFFVLKLLFGGLRGSRGNTIWALLSAVGIIHFWIRPIPRKLFFVGGVLLFAFMYAYGLFKAAGLDVLNALADADAREAIVAQSGRNLDYVILGDLGRSDVQAYVLYKISPPDSDFEYAWGRTYLGGLTSIIPSALWKNRPLSKIKEGTEALYGAGTFVPDAFWSSRQYGLAGEALLNFGPPGVPIAFLGLAFLVARLRVFSTRLTRYDARWFVYPALSVSCFVLLATDSDNIALMLLSQVAIPLALLWFVTRQVVHSSETIADAQA